MSGRERVYELSILSLIVIVDERRNEGVSNNTNPQAHLTFSPPQYVYLLIEMLTQCLQSLSHPLRKDTIRYHGS